MEITVEVQKNAQKNAKKLGLSKKLDEKIELFKKNPKLPGLHVEKLEPKQIGHWSFRINKQYRARFVKTEGKVIIINVEDYH